MVNLFWSELWRQWRVCKTLTLSHYNSLTPLLQLRTHSRTLWISRWGYRENNGTVPRSNSSFLSLSLVCESPPGLERLSRKRAMRDFDKNMSLWMRHHLWPEHVLDTLLELRWFHDLFSFPKENKSMKLHEAWNCFVVDTFGPKVAFPKGNLFGTDKGQG